MSIMFELIHPYLQVDVFEDGRQVTTLHSDKETGGWCRGDLISGPLSQDAETAITAKLSELNA